jgi:hypothetical protein
VKQLYKIAGAVCVCAVALLLNCNRSIAGSGGGSTTTDNASVTGQAFYATGLPVKGAFVRIRLSSYVRAIGAEPDSITRHDTTTNDSGWYHIDSLKTGEYRIEINDNTSSAAILTCNVVTKKDSIVLPPDTLATYQTITGKVDSALIGKPNLYVQVIGLNRIETVDSITGAFVIPDLAPGTYSLRIISTDTSVKPIVIDTAKTDTTAALSAIGIWTPSTGPYGGAFNSVTMGPQNTVFAGSQSYGIYRSNDNGATWTAVNTGLPGTSPSTYQMIYSLASIDSTVLAGMPGAGVYLSNDLGNHWTVAGAVGFAGNGMCTFTIAGSRIFAVASGALYVSVDKGGTWTQINTGTFVGTLASVAAGPRASDLFAGTNDGYIFMSPDTGVTWAQIIRFPYPGVHGFAIRGVNFVAATGSGIEISQDSGVTWTQTGTTVEFDMLIPGAGGSDLYAFYGDLGVYRSVDNGATWASATTALLQKYGYITPTGLAAGSNGSGGTMVFASTLAHGMIMSNDNGASWNETNNGLLASTIMAVAAVPNGVGGSNVLATDQAGTFLSVNSGTGWTWLPDGTAAFYNGFQANAFAAAFGGGGQTTVFAGGATGMYVSTLSGSSPWTPANTGMSDSNVLAVAVFRNAVFAGTNSGGVFMSVDNGASWTPRNTGLLDLHVNGFAVDSSAAGSVIFAATDTAGVFRSPDSGAHWTAANTGLVNQVRSLCVGPTRKGGHRLYAGTFTGLFASPDSGRTWSAISHPSIGTKIVLCLLACSDNQGGSFVIAGNPDGLYVSIDNGASWSLVGLAGGCVIESIALGLDGTGRRCLYAGTAGGGVWRLGLR